MMQSCFPVIYDNLFEKKSIESDDLDKLEQHTNDQRSNIVIDLMSSSEKSKRSRFAQIQSQIFQWFQKRSIVSGDPQNIVDEFQERNKRTVLSQNSQSVELCLKKIPSILQRRRKNRQSE